MDKTKLHNKAIQDILEDAKDGVLKDKNIKKVKELTKDKPKAAKKYDWVMKGKEYESLDDVKKLGSEVTDEVINQWINRGVLNRKG